MPRSALHAYIVGVALGDGNLSCPNDRAVRLRITCDSKYPALAHEITLALEKLFPDNKVSRVAAPKDSYFNISVYSNKLSELLPWRVGVGSKFSQSATVPAWVKNDRDLTRHCLKGLFQTDGSIYKDRGYLMVNFTDITLLLVQDVQEMIESLGYALHLYRARQKTGNYKYTVRLSKRTHEFVSEIGLKKD